MTALDISLTALAKARKLWPKAASARWLLGDATRLPFSSARFDIIIAYGLLHCLQTIGEVREVVSSIQLMTAPGGYNVLCSFNDRYQELHAQPYLDPVLPPHADLMALYQSWAILKATDEDLEEDHPPENIRHIHSLTRILAQRLT